MTSTKYAEEHGDSGTISSDSGAAAPAAPCAFCGQSPVEGQQFFGPRSGPAVCGRCVHGFSEIMAESARAAAWAQPQVLPSPRAIRAELDEHVVGQQRAKVDLSVAVYNHYKRRKYVQQGEEAPDVEIQKSNILLLGPTGTGKTELARAMSRMLGVPFHIADATTLTAKGYAGDDVETVLRGLVLQAGGNVERAEWGIVLIDEFDKIARTSGRAAAGYRDIGGQDVQQALLRLVEGHRVQLPPVGRVLFGKDPVSATEMDTTNVLFICAGSFAGGIEAIVGSRLNTGARIGFVGEGHQRRELDEREIYENVCEEDVLEFGIIPELVGRLPVLTSTLPLSEDEMVRILTEPAHALVKQYQALLAMEGVELSFDAAALRLIGREAMKRPTGARALRSIVEEHLKSAIYEHAGDSSVKAMRAIGDEREGCVRVVVERSRGAVEAQRGKRVARGKKRNQL